MSVSQERECRGFYDVEWHRDNERIARESLYNNSYVRPDGTRDHSRRPNGELKGNPTGGSVWG